MIRKYEDKDKDYCLRILREVGWMEGKDSDKLTMEAYFSDANVLVVEVNDEVELFGLTRPGSSMYQNADIPMSAVTGIVASRVARQLGMASKMTAQLIAESATDGAALSSLGIFDQGYYDKLGYGTMPYQRYSTFDPTCLKVPKLTRSPKRLTKDDALQMHECRLRRRRYHGSSNLNGVGITAAELSWKEHSFGLGFEDESGILTHFFWMNPKGEHGPYDVWFTGWETHAQLIELLSVMKSLSDQVHGFRMMDPQGLQLQDFLERPFATQRARKGGNFDTNCVSSAWRQCRILDMQTCIGAMKLCGKPLSFNVSITDPIEKYLPSDCAWKGVGGNWVLNLGENSIATEGRDDALQEVTCSINALSRLWSGSATAEALSVTSGLKADPKLISQIDDLVHIPAPDDDWEF